LVIRHGLEELLTDPARAVLERDVLPAYLLKRRWFGAKDEPMRQVRIAEAVILPALAPPALLMQVEVQTRRGNERYLLPIGFVSEEELSTALPQQLALARVRRGRSVGFMTDAFALDSFARRLLDLLAKAISINTATGVLSF